MKILLIKILLLVGLVLMVTWVNCQDTTKHKVDTLTLKGDVQTFNFLLYALDKADISHKDYKALVEWITNQLSKQIPNKAAPKK